MTNTALATPLLDYSTESSATSNPETDAIIELRSGLAAEMIDGRLRRAAKGRELSSYVLAFYLHELEESGKFRDLGYRCLAQYADQRLRIDPRRARELSCAGRALRTLTRIDQACREGRLCWTQAELLTHGVDECEQDEWIERAERASCSELRQMLKRHRRGLPAERGGDGGLPRAEFDLHVTLAAALHDKLEDVREELMRKRGTVVDDSEVFAYVLARYEVSKRDADAAARRAAACERDETPDWMRGSVIARDGGRCQACGTTEHLHVHHIVFRSRGGLTRESNLVTTCVGCHGLIHDGRLFASGQAPDSVTFRSRNGELLRPHGSCLSELRPPRTVLRLLQCGEPISDVGMSGDSGRPSSSRPSGGGGRPPRGTAESSVAPGPSLTESAGIPDPITPEWFLANMDRFEPGRDGVWRPVRGSRDRRRRSTGALPSCPKRGPYCRETTYDVARHA